MKLRRYTIVEACEEAGVEQGFVVECLRAHWVVPAYPAEAELDELDLARLRLIATLKEDLGVNDEAVPVILHLVDQLRVG
ncbi:chaperone modulator CbpM [Microbacterium sp. 18062]|uniref:chaperone modulator CbpM n=1 Tax=Microbacterium sp. 18062 TaxID=2681410 RepID=UPI00190F0A18|nr:chaperone modulator CbpM [Microbacterium sp. 18062]